MTLIGSGATPITGCTAKVMLLVKGSAPLCPSPEKPQAEAPCGAG
ncbi:hypothetical protein P775_24555 [Puniceibacterium antarcticum]|uniref:Uncharacterized protein n=1 Tax=Puniceibacterium antarcticum TaxID=1206336 RepID=A0A2G8R763_9RHOB|nr:hypothetical protein [Puniceibacterium antarcticum]PIL17377.1 hypothetical protein P775_24555 [Puniceibacterium antarcticum]